MFVEEDELMRTLILMRNIVPGYKQIDEHPMDPQADMWSDFLLNTSIAGLEKGDLFLFVGTNSRVEEPMVDGRIEMIQ